MSVFNTLLPPRVDNTYRGYRLALWLFGLVLLMKCAMSLNSIFNSSRVATSADGIPLDAYPPAAAATVVALFALLGLSRFMICLLGILVMVRYRGMIPLMFALLLLEQLSKMLVLRFLPIVIAGTPPASTINFVLLALLIVGLALSLWSRDDVSTGRADPTSLV